MTEPLKPSTVGFCFFFLIHHFRRKANPKTGAWHSFFPFKKKSWKGNVSFDLVSQIFGYQGDNSG